MKLFNSCFNFERDDMASVSFDFIPSKKIEQEIIYNTIPESTYGINTPVTKYTNYSSREISSNKSCNRNFKDYDSHTDFSSYHRTNMLFPIKQLSASINLSEKKFRQLDKSLNKTDDDDEAFPQEHIMHKMQGIKPITKVQEVKSVTTLKKQYTEFKDYEKDLVFNEKDILFYSSNSFLPSTKLKGDLTIYESSLGMGGEGVVF